MIINSHSLPTGRTNAICLPSGDHVGKLSRTFVVSARMPDPSTFMLKRPAPSRANAIRLPSGENAGAVAGWTPCVSCLRPLPEGAIRKICSTPTPGGWAPNTMNCGGPAEGPAARCGWAEAAEAAARTRASTTTITRQRTRPHRNAAPRMCGGAPHLATVALVRFDHRDPL